MTNVIVCYLIQFEILSEQYRLIIKILFIRII